MKVCAFGGGGVFLGPLHLTVACPTQNAKFKLIHPMLRPPRGPPVGELAVAHTPGQRPGGPGTATETRLMSKGSCCCETKSPGGS